MDISKLKKIKINSKLTPKAYFEQENEHLISIGLKKSAGIGFHIEGIHEGRLYFKDKETLKLVMADLKKIGIYPVIECDLTRIVAYKTVHASILYYYLKGRDIDCQGVFSKPHNSF